jgi:branched-chain amino acid transport system substrate-binding protein
VFLKEKSNRRWKKVRRVFLLAIVLAVMAMMAIAATPIKIGAVVPLGDITGDQASKAMRLAVEEINAAGGVLGRPLELIVIDDELKPEKGAAAIEKLATVDRVDFFVGGMSSGVHLAQIPIMKRYQKITIWIGAASYLCENAVGPTADWYFHLHPWDYQQGESYGRGWSDIVAAYPEITTDRIFLAYEEGGFGTASYDSYIALQKLAAQGEGTWAGVINDFRGESFKSAALGGGDYRAMLQQAKAYNPDLFIWAGYDADALPILQQAKEIGFAPKLFVGAPPGWPAHFGDSPLAEGVTLYGMWAPTLNKVSPVAEHFWNAYIERYKEEPATYFAPLGYTNIYFLVEGIKAAGTIEKAALIKALAELEYDSPIGEVLTISPSNVIKHQGFTAQKILQWQNGEQQVIWPLELKTSEPEYPFPKWEGR